MSVVLNGDHGLAVKIVVGGGDVHGAPGTVALTHRGDELRLLFHHAHSFPQSTSAADFLLLDGTGELFVDHNLMVATLRAHVLTCRAAFLRQRCAGIGVGVQQGDAVVVAIVGVGDVVVDHQAVVDEVGVRIVGHIADDALAKCGLHHQVSLHGCVGGGVEWVLIRDPPGVLRMHRVVTVVGGEVASAEGKIGSCTRRAEERPQAGVSLDAKNAHDMEADIGQGGLKAVCQTEANANLCACPEACRE